MRCAVIQDLLIIHQMWDIIIVHEKHMIEHTMNMTIGVMSIFQMVQYLLLTSLAILYNMEAEIFFVIPYQL